MSTTRTGLAADGPRAGACGGSWTRSSKAPSVHQQRPHGPAGRGTRSRPDHLHRTSTGWMLSSGVDLRAVAAGRAVALLTGTGGSVGDTIGLALTTRSVGSGRAEGVSRGHSASTRTPGSTGRPPASASRATRPRSRAPGTATTAFAAAHLEGAEQRHPQTASPRAPPDPPAYSPRAPTRHPLVSMTGRWSCASACWSSSGGDGS
jgi:hypothetical protein